MNDSTIAICPECKGDINVNEKHECKSDNQFKNRPWLWQKGQSGNPKGRPKGKTMKEYAKELLACQTEEERQEFLHGLDKDVIWRMAEGNPANNTDITTGGQPLVLPSEVIKKYGLNTSSSTEGDSKR